jgi:preprotein translocase subunit YajC
MASPVQPSLVESLGSMVPLFLVFGAAMWFLSIRPAMKRQKETEALQKSLKKGDRVLTQAGFFAEVDRVEESGNVVLKLSDGVKLEFQRQAIVSKVKEG